MAGHRSYNVLRRRIARHRRERVDKLVHQELQRMLLADLRRLSGMTQVQLARALGVKQPTLSQLESQPDMQISTLRRIIEALGGNLELTANLPTGRITLSQFKEERPRRKSA